MTEILLNTINSLHAIILCSLNEKMFCLITSNDFYLLYPLSGLSFQVNQNCPSLLSISKMAEKQVHKKIEVLENKITYFDGLGYHISL